MAARGGGGPRRGGFVVLRFGRTAAAAVVVVVVARGGFTRRSGRSILAMAVLVIVPLRLLVVLHIVEDFAAAVQGFVVLAAAAAALGQCLACLLHDPVGPHQHFLRLQIVHLGQQFAQFHEALLFLVDSQWFCEFLTGRCFTFIVPIMLLLPLLLRRAIRHCFVVVIGFLRLRLRRSLDSYAATLRGHRLYVRADAH